MIDDNTTIFAIVARPVYYFVRRQAAVKVKVLNQPCYFDLDKNLQQGWDYQPLTDSSAAALHYRNDARNRKETAFF